MSKTDAMRAMREARYARLSASRTPTPTTTTTTTTTPSPARRPAAATPAPAPAPTAGAAAASEPVPEPAGTSPVTGTALCGHRSMNGRSCTREAGHPQKNHRYG